MVAEDYVSFEVAKLLKEKGFPQSLDGISAMYDSEGSFASFLSTSRFHIFPDDFGETDFVAPTHQMVLRWLGEVHKIYIQIVLYSMYEPVYYRWVASKNGRVVSDEELPSKEIECHVEGEYPNFAVFYKKHNVAAEAALKHCLTKMI